MIFWFCWWGSNPIASPTSQHFSMSPFKSVLLSIMDSVGCSGVDCEYWQILGFKYCLSKCKWSYICWYSLPDFTVKSNCACTALWKSCSSEEKILSSSWKEPWTRSSFSYIARSNKIEANWSCFIKFSKRPSAFLKMSWILLRAVSTSLVYKNMQWLLSLSNHVPNTSYSAQSLLASVTIFKIFLVSIDAIGSCLVSAALELDEWILKFQTKRYVHTCAEENDWN